jgi:hypothetical protein
MNRPLSRKWSNSEFLLDAAIADLVEELPNCLAIADGVAIETEEGKVKWWSDHEMALPISTAVKKILLVQPSSASAERVFSLLQTARCSVGRNCQGLSHPRAGGAKRRARVLIPPGYLHPGKRKH